MTLKSKKKILKDKKEITHKRSQTIEKNVGKFNYIKNFNFSATEDILKLSKDVRC